MIDHSSLFYARIANYHGSENSIGLDWPVEPGNWEQVQRPVRCRFGNRIGEITRLIWMSWPELPNEQVQLNPTAGWFAVHLNPTTRFYRENVKWFGVFELATFSMDRYSNQQC